MVDLSSSYRVWNDARPRYLSPEAADADPGDESVWLAGNFATGTDGGSMYYHGDPGGGRGGDGGVGGHGGH